MKCYTNVIQIIRTAEIYVRFNNIIKSHVLKFTCVNTHDTQYINLFLSTMRKTSITYRSGDICRSV